MEGAAYGSWCPCLMAAHACSMKVNATMRSLPDPMSCGTDLPHCDYEKGFNLPKAALPQNSADLFHL